MARRVEPSSDRGSTAASFGRVSTANILSDFDAPGLGHSRTANWTREVVRRVSLGHLRGRLKPARVQSRRVGSEETAYDLTARMRHRPQRRELTSESLASLGLPWPTKVCPSDLESDVRTTCLQRRAIALERRARSDAYCDHVRSRRRRAVWAQSVTEDDDDRTIDGRRLLPRRRLPGGHHFAHRGARGIAGGHSGLEAQRGVLHRRGTGPGGGGLRLTCTLPFGGVPIGVKELDPVKGWPQTEASLVFKDRVAEYDATTTVRLPRRRRRARRRRRRRRSSAASTAPTPACTGRPRTRTTSSGLPVDHRAARPRRSRAGCFLWAPAATAVAPSGSRPASPDCSA